MINKSFILIVFLFFPFWAFASVVYEQPYIGTDYHIINPSDVHNGFYQYFVGGINELANPPITDGFIIPSDYDTVRIKRISGQSCENISTGSYGGMISTLGSSKETFFQGNTQGDYCVFNLCDGLGSAGSVGNIYFIGQGSDLVLDGSPKNNGVSVDGYNDHKTIGGFAFQLCDNHVCDRDFIVSTSTATTTVPSLEGYSNVLFIPGLEASRLYKQDYNGSTDKLWEPRTDSDIENLLMDEQGNSIRDDIYTKDVIDNAYLVNVGNIYKTFLESLDKWKNEEHTIKDYAVIPYDWRLSLDDILNNGAKYSDGRLYYAGPNGATSTPYIIQELRRLAKSSPTGKVTIVAHSNGGLVTKALTNKLGEEASSLIDKIIFVAVPQVGTPKAVGALLHGYEQGLPIDSFHIFMTPKDARYLGQNMQSAYNLIPSESYFTYVDDPVIKIDDSLPDWVSRYGNEIHSKERLHNFLVDTNGRVSSTSPDINSPSVVNSNLLIKAENEHLSLDNWVPPVGVKQFEIAGWGEDTLATIEYYKGQKRVCMNSSPNGTCSNFELVPTVLYRPIEVVDGDGTVVVPSALWTATSTGVEKYWVDLAEYGASGILNSTVNRKHASILEIPELNIFIDQIITNSTSSLPKFIYTSMPQYNKDKQRLRFLLHSPLDVSVVDNLGNIVSSSTSDILGASFSRYGEVQVVTVPKGIPITLNLNGYATGSFTLDTEEINGNNQIIASSTFSAIPSATSTKATIEFLDGTLQNSSPLSVDYNGDDADDFVVVPKMGEIVTLDTISPEAKISFSTSTKQIVFQGLDTGSNTSILISTTSAIVSDVSNNDLKISFSKYVDDYGKLELGINKLQYSASTTDKVQNTSLKYAWSLNSLGQISNLDQNIVTDLVTINSHYDTTSSKTIIKKDTVAYISIVRRRGVETPIKTIIHTEETKPGIVIVGVKTKEGIISVDY